MSADIGINHPDCCGDHWHNITHNLGAMFRAAGIDWHDYYAADGNGGRLASEMLPEAVLAYFRLKNEPEDFKHLDAPNGWGVVANAIDFLERLIRDLAKHPDGVVEVSL